MVDSPASPPRVALVTGASAGIGAAIAQGLGSRGWSVALLCDDDADVTGVADVVHTRFADRGDVERAFAGAVEHLGVPEMVVLAAVAPEALVVAPVEDLDEDAWTAACDGSLKRMLYALQATHAHLAGHATAVFVVGPTLSLTGAAGLAPLATAAEGQRALAKSAARQWGSSGINVNCISVAPDVFSPVLAGVAAPPPPEPSPPALGRVADGVDDVAGLLALLSSADGRVLTGASVAVDGGTWMAP